MKTLALIMGVSILGYSCADLEVENFNARNRSVALVDPADLVALIEGAMVDLIWTTQTFLVVNYDLQADIMTSTNASNNYWGDSDEPRRRIDNTTTFDDKGNIEFMWEGCNAAVSTANNVINAITVEGIELIVDGDDLTQKTLAAAYMMKGIAQGYLGYVYDQGFVVEIDTDLETLELQSHTVLTASSVANFELAKAIYAADASLVFDYITTGDDLSAAETIQLANSYAARFLIGQARTNAEAAGLDYATIRTYAQGGLTEDWSPISDNNIIYNGQHSWATFTVTSANAGYLPTDLQVLYLFSKEGPGPLYEKVYPETVLLPSAVSDDARLTSDFNDSRSIGWLRADRNRSIFSTYVYTRYEYNYATSNSENPMHIVRASEADLIEAEAEARLGNYAAARTIIEAGPRATRGGLAALPDAAQGTVEDAIWYENMIELHAGGAAIALAYMRRWDRLQEGSYLHLPVPAKELEINGFPLYTFGGAGMGSEEGTADGANSWKND